MLRFSSYRQNTPTPTPHFGQPVAVARVKAPDTPKGERYVDTVIDTMRKRLEASHPDGTLGPTRIDMPPKSKEVILSTAINTPADPSDINTRISYQDALAEAQQQPYTIWISNLGLASRPETTDHYSLNNLGSVPRYPKK